MRVLWGLGVLTVTLALLPAPAPAQSLGELAAREKERKEREGKKPPAKSFTDADLGTRSGSGTVSQPASSTATSEAAGQEGEVKTETQTETKTDASQPAAPPQKTAEEIRAEAEKAWRANRQVVQGEITRLTDSIKVLEGRLADPMVPPNYHPGLKSQLDTAKQSRVRALEEMDKIEVQGRDRGFRPE